MLRTGPSKSLLAFIVIALAGCTASCGFTQANAVHVAVAANFTQPADEIAQIFQRSTGNTIVMSFGSTGQLYTQITQDAPFEVFLSADAETPMRAVSGGFGVKDSIITYAIGRLVLFSTTLDVSDGESVLRNGQFAKLSIANPMTAPYGAAALETLKSLGLDQQLQGKLVQGTSITQAFQFIETGNADLGFVSRSQVTGRSRESVWQVPDTLYSPIRQDAVLLRKGLEDEGARAFLQFLKSPEAVAVIEKFGYLPSS